MKPWVVMRSHNDIDVVRETLQKLSTQTRPHSLMVLDNASSDGTREVVTAYADRIVDVPEGEYMPGRVLNLAMRETEGELVAFINSDCTPVNDDWLENLLTGFTSEEVVAVFGRQVARPDCEILFAKDTEETFGDGSRQASWRHCFSMASSAIRRCAWEKMQFSENLKYSEDIDWTWRQRQAGGQINYVADSVVYHSHNYTLAEWRRRQYGEGMAEAEIFEWEPWEGSLLRYSLLPFGRQVFSDIKYGISVGKLSVLWQSPALRYAQLMGRRQGFMNGSRRRSK